LCTILKHLGFLDYAQVLEHRLLLKTGGQLQDLRWVFNGRTEIVRVSLSQFIPLLDLITSVLLNTPLMSLNNHSLHEIINFSKEDQRASREIQSIFFPTEFQKEYYSRPGEYYYQ